jgi:hypothetical protein
MAIVPQIQCKLDVTSFDWDYHRTMLETQLQALCERGQIELMETRYLDAVDTLAEAERHAWEMRSFDTLARLYLPLQEARRQIRQRCGEGAVRMRLFPSSPIETIVPQKVLIDNPHGQLLVGGWETIQPAVEVRQMAREQRLYLETFLASTNQDLITIVPLEKDPSSANCLELKSADLPADIAHGNAESFAGVMALWERLHMPYLLAANAESDQIRKMQAYRLTLEVDPACELAHQYLADIARKLARS